jgi:hypothetical protein
MNNQNIRYLYQTSYMQERKEYGDAGNHLDESLFTDLKTDGRLLDNSRNRCDAFLEQDG